MILFQNFTRLVFLMLNTDLTLILRKKYNEKNGSMYILPEALQASCKKGLNKDTNKST